MVTHKIPKLIFFPICLLAILMLTECKEHKSQKNGTLFGSSVYSSPNLVLNSAAITSHFKTDPVSDSIKNQVTLFYTSRNYQYAWFNQKGITDAASIFYNQLQNYKNDFANNDLNNAELDNLFIWAQTDEKEFYSQANCVEELELLLTTTFFKYANKAYGGIAKTPLDLEWFIPRKKKNYQALLDSLLVSTKGETIQEPLSKAYFQLKEKLRQYRDIQKKGGLPVIVPTKTLLITGDIDICLFVAKQHLLLTGDLSFNDNNAVFTDALQKAVKHFQQRMGLVETGRIDTATLNELNKSIDFRIQQIMVNMERLRWMPVKMEKDYIIINIPEYQLHVYENDTSIWATNVVVGKNATKTSIFKSNLSEIVLNPYWGVPTSIVRSVILPQLKLDRSYLVKNNMELMGADNQVVNTASINWHKYKTNMPFTVRQKPGKDNALGKIKFLFPNQFSIYLHDTPAKDIFGETKRAFSHGCIRVNQPEKLAIYLLRKDSLWNAAKIDSILATDNEMRIAVSHTIPVYIAYFTAWVGDDGQINFRNDVYNLDSKLLKDILGE